MVQRFSQRHTGIQGRGLERLYTSIQGTVTATYLTIRPHAVMQEGLSYMEARNTRIVSVICKTVTIIRRIRRIGMYYCIIYRYFCINRRSI